MSLPAPKLDFLAWKLLSLLAILWGTSFVFMEMVLETGVFGPIAAVFARLLIGALGLWCFLAIARAPIPTGLSTWRDLAVMGILNNALPFCLIAWGQLWITGGLASVLNGMTPIFGVVAAHFLTRDEKMTPARLAGVVLGFAGVAVLIGPSVFGELAEHFLGSLAVLGATISYAFSGLWGKRLASLNPLSAATGQVSCSALIIAPIALWLAEPIPAFDPFDLSITGPLLMLGIFSTSLAYIVFFAIIRRAGGSNVMLVTLMIPAVAVLLGVIVLDETITRGQIEGMALIALALLCIDGRLFSRLRSRRRRQKQG
ncbi:MAG: DMT family transporter [Ectothiorhodospiraceae bacterium AqS1]|nr:DMT family transporter [Ectothiorhodospiraceae bacterium AqS1]